MEMRDLEIEGEFLKKKTKKKYKPKTWILLKQTLWQIYSEVKVNNETLEREDWLTQKQLPAIKLPLTLSCPLLVLCVGKVFHSFVFDAVSPNHLAIFEVHTCDIKYNFSYEYAWSRFS